jgi:superfamily II DNA or RNA helicase
MSAAIEGFRLREYQETAYQSVMDSLKEYDSTLGVMATGGGKTVVFGHVARDWEHGRVLMIAHREELILQGAQSMERILGEPVAIEMGRFTSDESNLFGVKSKVVVATVQTISKESRALKFDPHEFGLVIVDEAHHATAESYRAVLQHFSQGGCKVLGVTATPDRSDEEALGQVFQSVAFDIGIHQLIQQGYLVPISQQMVNVEGLDFSNVRDFAGDLSQKQLAEVIEEEKVLHGFVDPIYEIAGDRKTILFAVSVAQAVGMCEILNRHEPGCAGWISGETDRDERRNTLRAYRNGDIRFLCNCMIATEGFDEPGIEVVAVTRPTKSRALYSQMIGRGTRPLPGVVDDLDSDLERRTAIASSAKPRLTVLDFVGNAGKHKLITTADVLGNSYPDHVVAAALQKMREMIGGRAMDVLEVLEKSQEEDRERERQKERERQEREVVRKKKVVGKAKFSTQAIDPFVMYDVAHTREPFYLRGKRPSKAQREVLEKRGIDTRNLTAHEASTLIPKVKEAPSIKQLAILRKNKISPEGITQAHCGKIISKLIANQWRPLTEYQKHDLEAAGVPMKPLK